MEKPREISIGDVHGCFDDLVALLKTIGPIHPQDQIIFIGDLFDRGNNSLGVYELVRHMKETMPEQVTILRGNHEDMLFDYLGLPSVKPYDLGLFLEDRNGGESTIKSFGSRRALLDAAEWLLENTVLQFETDSATYVHAGLWPGEPTQDKDKLWMRHVLSAYYQASFRQHYRPGKPIIAGHTPVNEAPEITYRCNLVMIDSGCYADRWLTGFDVLNRVAYYSFGDIRPVKDEGAGS